VIGKPQHRHHKGDTYSVRLHLTICALSRHAALRRWSGRALIDELAAQGIVIRSPSARGVAEEAPGAYKDVGAVVAAASMPDLRACARLFASRDKAPSAHSCASDGQN